MLIKYAEALGSGLGILSQLRNWEGIQVLQEKCAFDALEHLPRIEEGEETDSNSVWIAIGRAALRARLSKVALSQSLIKEAMPNDTI